MVGESELRPHFSRSWTKVHQIKFATPFPIDGLFAFRRYSRSSCAKLGRNFDVFGPPNWEGERATQIANGISNIWITIEHVVGLKFGDDRPSDLPRLGGGEKKDLNDGSKT